MKKAVPAIALSAAGVTWLLHAQGLIDASSKSGRSPASVSTTGSAAGSTTTTAAEAPTTTNGSVAPSTTPTGTGKRTSDGPTIDTRYGPVQVEAVLEGSKLVDVRVLQSPADRRRSQEINDQAIPLLHDQAIQAQSAQIDGVSGATYTTNGYEQSLQAALDQAK